MGRRAKLLPIANRLRISRQPVSGGLATAAQDGILPHISGVGTFYDLTVAALLFDWCCRTKSET